MWGIKIGRIILINLKINSLGLQMSRYIKKKETHKRGKKNQQNEKKERKKERKKEMWKKWIMFDGCLKCVSVEGRPLNR